jgi:hypothetical protein
MSLFSELFSILSNTEQPPGKLIWYHWVQLMTMGQQILWRFEVHDPRTSSEWRPLWPVEESQLVVSLKLRDELNKINAPIQLRIVRCSD